MKGTILGGIESTPAEVAGMTYMFEGEDKLVTENFPCYTSLDGTKVLVRICRPEFIENGVCKSWYRVEQDVVDRFIAVVGEERILTEEQFNTLYKSEYSSTEEVV